MDTTLVTVTVLSMGMAATLSVIVWRLLRDERRRSEARVAALTEAAFSSSTPHTSKPAARPRTTDAVPATPAKRDAIPSSALPSSALRASEGRRASEGQPRVASAFPGLNERERVEGLALSERQRVEGPALSERQRVEGPALSERQRVEGRRSSADDLPLHESDTPLSDTPFTTTGLFGEAARTSPWGSRFVVMAALALVGTAVVFVAMTMTRPSAPTAAKSAPAAPAPERAAAGLELLSLRDRRDAGALTITGMVQNPRTGSLHTRVAVVAYAFDDKGSFLASGRALLDVTSLAPGDESPFVVTVPVTGAVARYRIGFRGEDGRVIAHVDKRQQSPMAALRLGSGQALRLGSGQALRLGSGQALRLGSGQAHW